MSEIDEIYRMFHTGLEVQAGPEDPLFTEAWDIHTAVTHMVGVRLLEERMGASITAAEEVQVQLVRHARVMRVCQGMPLQIPQPAVRALKTAGRYLEDTDQVAELTEYLRLSSPIADNFGEYAGRVLGRQATPVISGLELLARAGAIMSDSLTQSVPGLK